MVDISKDAKLAALVVKNEMAPLDSSSFSTPDLIPGNPKNFRESGFCLASSGTVLYHAGNCLVMMALVALKWPEVIKIL